MPHDPGDEVGNPVNQGRPAEPGSLRQPLALGSQAGGRLPALPGKIGPNPLGVRRPGPQAVAVPVPIPIFIQVFPAGDLLPVHAALEGPAGLQGLPIGLVGPDGLVQGALLVFLKFAERIFGCHCYPSKIYLRFIEG